MEDTLVYLVLSLLLCGLYRITALNQSGDSAKNSSRENSPIQTDFFSSIYMYSGILKYLKVFNIKSMFH